MRPRLRTFSSIAVGVVICAWSAAFLCILFHFHAHPAGAIIPVAFLAIVILVALRFGSAAGVLGSAIAALIFACFLYQPLGTVSVEDPAARMNLGWLVLGGLACSYLIAPAGPQQHR